MAQGINVHFSRTCTHGMLSKHSARIHTQNENERIKGSQKHLHPCEYTIIYEGWNFNGGNYLFTTDTK